ncbi:MAG: tetratricopeptide repeat protein [Planctomycetaceae bacterium]|nr:tetratricopeptide repeat protein [Planctomycetaceae bacterium]
MRRLNFKLAGILLASLLVFGGVAYAVHGFQVKRNAVMLLREAKRAKDKKEFKTSMDFYSRYVQLVPGKQSAESLAELGFLQAEIGRIGQAYRSFDVSLRREPAQDKVRWRQVEIALQLRRFVDARQHVDFLLKTQPQDGQLLEWRGDSELGLKHYVTADGDYKQAIEAAPDRVDAYARRAWILHNHLKASPQALQILNDMVTANSDNSKAYWLRGVQRLAWLDGVRRGVFTPAAGDEANPAVPAKILTESQAVDELVEDARTALRLSPDDQDAIQFGLSALIADAGRRGGGDVKSAIDNARKQADEIRREARDLGARGIKLSPKNVALYAGLAEIELQNLDRDSAIQWMKMGLDAIPKQPMLLWNLANMLAESGRVAEAETYLEELKKTNYPQAQIGLLKARLLMGQEEMGQEEWAVAKNKLEEVRASLVNWPSLLKQADFWLGECYEKLGDHDLQRNAYRGALAIDPDWMPARIAMADSLEVSGRIDEAINEYLAVARLPNPPVAVLFKIPQLILFVNRRPNAAEPNWTIVNQILEQLEERVDPDLLQLILLKADVLLAQKQVLLAQEQVDRAQRLLEKKFESDPTAVEIWLVLVTLAERDKKWARALELLDEVRSKAGDSVTWRLAMARHEVNQHSRGASAAIHDQATPLDSFTPDEVRQLSIGLASLAFSIRDFEQAERLSRSAAEAEKTDLRPWQLLLEIAVEGNDASLLDEVLKKIKAIDGDSALSRYAEATQLVIQAAALDRQDEDRHKKFLDAKQLLEKAMLASPTSSRLPLLLAKIDDVEQNEPSAIANYQKAIGLGERSLNVVGRTGELLYRTGQFAEADKMICRLQEQQAQFSSELKTIAADIALHLEDSGRAIDFAKQVALGSKEPRELVWAGRILQSLEKYSEAEASFLRAIELDPSAEEPRIALIQYYSRRENTLKVDEAIAAAEQHIDPERVDFALAEVYASIGRLAQAEARYQAASEAAKDDRTITLRFADFLWRIGKSQEAIPLLKQLTERSASVSADVRVVSRRKLARALAARGHKEGFDEALKLLDENLKEKLPEPQAEKSKEIDLREKAFLLANRGEEFRREAIKILEHLLEKRGAKAVDELRDERFLLAQLYWLLKDRSSRDLAMLQMKSLVVTHSQQPEFLVKYIQYLLEVETPDVAEADVWLTRLRGIALVPPPDRAGVGIGKPDKDSLREEFNRRRERLEFEKIGMSASVRMAQKRYDDLLTMVDDYVEEAGLEAADSDVRVANAARLLETQAVLLNRPGNAETSEERSTFVAKFNERSGTFYDKNAQQRPKETLALAAFHARQGRSGKSLDLLEKEWRGARPTEIMAVTSTLITSGATSPDDSARAEKILRDALTVWDRPVVLLLGLADLQSWREVIPASEENQTYDDAKNQTYDDAENLYREVLEKELRNPVAMNNLALLLALRGGHDQEPLQLINQAIAFVGNDAALLDSRATIYLALNNPQKAGDDLLKSLQGRETALSLFHMAQVKHRLGQLEDARDSMAKAIEANLKMQDVHPLERPALKELQDQLQ